MHRCQHYRQKVDSSGRMEAVATPSGIGAGHKHGSLVMAKNRDGGRLLPLPSTTFGEAVALGFEASVYCSRCYEYRPVDPAAEHLRDRCFATARFRCTKIRYTGAGCGSGSVVINPPVLLSVGGEDTLDFLYCNTCEPSWEINHMPIDKPPWSVLDRKGNDRFGCPGCGKAVARVAVEETAITADPTSRAVLVRPVMSSSPSSATNVRLGTAGYSGRATKYRMSARGLAEQAEPAALIWSDEGRR